MLPPQLRALPFWGRATRTAFDRRSWEGSIKKNDHALLDRGPTSIEGTHCPRCTNNEQRDRLKVFRTDDRRNSERFEAELNAPHHVVKNSGKGRCHSTLAEPFLMLEC
jgi:hypothetical protein